jgi:hypothetical protein
MKQAAQAKQPIQQNVDKQLMCNHQTALRKEVARHAIRVLVWCWQDTDTS